LIHSVTFVRVPVERAIAQWKNWKILPAGHGPAFEHTELWVHAPRAWIEICTKPQLGVRERGTR